MAGQGGLAEGAGLWREQKGSLIPPKSKWRLAACCVRFLPRKPEQMRALPTDKTAKGFPQCSAGLERNLPYESEHTYGASSNISPPNKTETHTGQTAKGSERTAVSESPLWQPVSDLDWIVKERFHPQLELMMRESLLCAAVDRDSCRHASRHG